MRRRGRPRELWMACGEDTWPLRAKHSQGAHNRQRLAQSGHCGDVGKLVLSACAMFQAGKRLPWERRAGSARSSRVYGAEH